MTDIPSPKSVPLWLWALLTILPIAVTILTNAATANLDWFKERNGDLQKNRELDIKMVELGVGIMKAAPEKGSENADKEAKKWAMDVLGRYSGVFFSEDAKKAISTAQSPINIVASALEAEVVQTSGWVAVGFLDSPGDSLFTKPDGTSISALKAGDVIKANQAVNIRPDVAAWGRVSSVLQTGQCFEIGETVVKSAAGAKQTWASGAVSDCAATSR